MNYFNPRKYSYYDFMRRYKHYKKMIKSLKAKLVNYNNHRLDNEDVINSLQQTLNNREQQIAQLKQIIMNNTHIKPKPKVIDDESVLGYPKDHTDNPGDGLPNSIASIQVDKGERYTIDCTVPLGQAFAITQYPTSENNSVYESPGNRDNKYVTFFGNNQDGGDAPRLIMNFQSNVSDTLFITPKWWARTKNYTFTHYEEPYDNPRFPFYDIPYPNTDNVKGKHSPVNQKVITLLDNLLKGLKSGKLDIPDIEYHEDENGDYSYAFTANAIKPKYSFLKAVSQLNSTNGMKRAGSDKDYWVALDANDNLYKKYRGSNKLVPYQPTAKDIEAKDWEVLQIQPANPDTKPYGSDNWDDLNDTNMFGYDGAEPGDGDF